MGSPFPLSKSFPIPFLSSHSRACIPLIPAGILSRGFKDKEILGKNIPKEPWLLPLPTIPAFPWLLEYWDIQILLRACPKFTIPASFPLNPKFFKGLGIFLENQGKGFPGKLWGKRWEKRAGRKGREKTVGEKWQKTKGQGKKGRNEKRSKKSRPSSGFPRNVSRDGHSKHCSAPLIPACIPMEQGTGGRKEIVALLDSQS